jgi:hypothetical protein
MAQTRDGSCRGQNENLNFLWVRRKERLQSTLILNLQSLRYSIFVDCTKARHIERPMGADGNYLSLCQPYCTCECSFSVLVRASLPRHLSHPKFLLLSSHLPQTQDKDGSKTNQASHNSLSCSKGAPAFNHIACYHLLQPLHYPPQLTPMAYSAALVH